MAFRVTSTLPKFDQVEFLGAQEWRQIGLYAIELIRRRTARGLDATGSPFADYSEGYRLAREEYGRPTSPVDLTVSGDMLNGLQVVDVAKHSVTLGWTR